MVIFVKLKYLFMIFDRDCVFGYGECLDMKSKYVAIELSWCVGFVDSRFFVLHIFNNRCCNRKNTMLFILFKKELFSRYVQMGGMTVEVYFSQ